MAHEPVLVIEKMYDVQQHTSINACTLFRCTIYRWENNGNENPFSSCTDFYKSHSPEYKEVLLLFTLVIILNHDQCQFFLFEIKFTNFLPEKQADFLDFFIAIVGILCNFKD